MSVKKKEKLRLSIDTTDNLKTVVKLGGKTVVKNYQDPREQELLGLIKKVLEETNTGLNQIKKIRVKTGPGSFTGIRVGVAVANALAWVLKIKVNGQTMVTPVYD